MAKEIENTEEEVTDIEAGADEKRVYELGFHLDPELPQEEVKKTYQTIRDQIAAVGTIVAEGEPTKVPLAYTISRSDTTGRRDFNSSFFCWIAYETDGAGHANVAAMANTEKRIFRFLDIRTTVDAAKQAAEMHEIFAKAALEPEVSEEDAAADVELDAALKEAGV